ncbi:MAG: hypothetical protein WC755_04270 [Candidatus Woesearchaeota archaeon]
MSHLSRHKADTFAIIITHAIKQYNNENICNTIKYGRDFWDTLCVVPIGVSNWYNYLHYNVKAGRKTFE